jgi:hypothetical protein
LSFTALITLSVWMINRILSLYIFSTYSFILANFGQPLRVQSGLG